MSNNKDNNKDNNKEMQPVDVNKELQAGKTKYDVFYHVADILYNFFCFKKISYFFIFVIGIIAIILAAKSDSTVDFLIPFGKSVEWFDNKLEGHLYSIVITILLFISFAGNVLQKKVYKKEINRIAKLRKEVIHGQNNDNWRPLKKHISSSSKMLKKQINDDFYPDGD